MPACSFPMMTVWRKIELLKPQKSNTFRVHRLQCSLIKTKMETKMKMKMNMWRWRWRWKWRWICEDENEDEYVKMETKMKMKMNMWRWEHPDRQNELAKEASCSCHCPEFQSSNTVYCTQFAQCLYTLLLWTSIQWIPQSTQLHQFHCRHKFPVQSIL